MKQHERKTKAENNKLQKKKREREKQTDLVNTLKNGKTTMK